eukprot:scaffold31_cov334-Pavlova_lutheri.AAC.20
MGVNDGPAFQGASCAMGVRWVPRRRRNCTLSGAQRARMSVASSSVWSMASSWNCTRRARASSGKRVRMILRHSCGVGVNCAPPCANSRATLWSCAKGSGVSRSIDRFEASMAAFTNPGAASKKPGMGTASSSGLLLKESSAYPCKGGAYASTSQADKACRSAPLLCPSAKAGASALHVPFETASRCARDVMARSLDARTAWSKETAYGEATLATPASAKRRRSGP